MPQVRVILRDISGKFSWDASILYSSPQSPGTEDREGGQWAGEGGGAHSHTIHTVTSPPRHTTRYSTQ